MRSSVQATAIRGRAQSTHDRLAKSLGYLSLALGAAELIAPRALCRATGLSGMEPLVRAYGARELATGVAILASHDPAPWIWGRVAGDMVERLEHRLPFRVEPGQQGDPLFGSLELSVAPSQ